jgi:Holliday junction resolvase-like predicted endonuclease
LFIKATRLPAQIVEEALGGFSRMELFTDHSGIIEASPSQRLRMAVHALNLNADFEHVCGLLSWAEFEGIAAQAFEINGYRVIRNFRFKGLTKRWETDILAVMKPVILCIDCKRWRHGWRGAATAKAVEAQVDRTMALAEALPIYKRKLNLEDWQTAQLTPLVLSLVQGPHRFQNDVPVVPILQLQNFINEFPLASDSLRHFSRKLKYDNETLTSSFTKKPKLSKQ